MSQSQRRLSHEDLTRVASFTGLATKWLPSQALDSLAYVEAMDGALAEREILRREPAIQAKIALLFGMFAKESVSKVEYIELYTRIRRVLRDQTGAQAAHEFWMAATSEGAPSGQEMGREEFAEATFDLVDRWTVDTAVSAYAQWLQSLYDELTQWGPKGDRVWKPIKDLRYLPSLASRDHPPTPMSAVADPKRWGNQQRDTAPGGSVDSDTDEDDEGASTRTDETSETDSSDGEPAIFGPQGLSPKWGDVPDATGERRALVENKEIRQVINVFWRLHRASVVAGKYNNDGGEGAYTQLCLRIAAAVYPDFSARRTRKVAKRNWAMQGVKVGYWLFSRLIFELADRWVAGFKPEDYVDWLSVLSRELTRPLRPGEINSQRVWQVWTEIEFCPRLSKEHRPRLSSLLCPPSLDCDEPTNGQLSPAYKHVRGFDRDFVAPSNLSPLEIDDVGCIGTAALSPGHAQMEEARTVIHGVLSEARKQPLRVALAGHKAKPKATNPQQPRLSTGARAQRHSEVKAARLQAEEQYNKARSASSNIGAKIDEAVQESRARVVVDIPSADLPQLALFDGPLGPSPNATVTPLGLSERRDHYPHPLIATGLPSDEPQLPSPQVNALTLGPSKRRPERREGSFVAKSGFVHSSSLKVGGLALDSPCHRGRVRPSDSIVMGGNEVSLEDHLLALPHPSKPAPRPTYPLSSDSLSLVPPAHLTSPHPDTVSPTANKATVASTAHSSSRGPSSLSTTSTTIATGPLPSRSPTHSSSLPTTVVPGPVPSRSPTHSSSLPTTLQSRNPTVSNSLPSTLPSTLPSRSPALSSSLPTTIASGALSSTPLLSRSPPLLGPAVLSSETLLSSAASTGGALGPWPQGKEAVLGPLPQGERHESHRPQPLLHAQPRADDLPHLRQPRSPQPRRFVSLSLALRRQNSSPSLSESVLSRSDGAGSHGQTLGALVPPRNRRHSTTEPTGLSSSSPSPLEHPPGSDQRRRQTLGPLPLQCEPLSLMSTVAQDQSPQASLSLPDPLTKSPDVAPPLSPRVQVSLLDPLPSTKALPQASSPTRSPQSSSPTVSRSPPAARSPQSLRRSTLSPANQISLGPRPDSVPRSQAHTLSIAPSGSGTGAALPPLSGIAAVMPERHPGPLNEALAANVLPRVPPPGKRVFNLQPR